MRPLALKSDALRHQLQIDWDDSSTQVFAIADLRHQCPCAECRSTRRTAEIDANANLHIIDIQLIGQYGARMTFSDGHDKGIFPWVFLRGLASSMV
jgi:DUF971 family protein